MTVQQFREALKLALSFRLQQLSHMENLFEKDLAESSSTEGIGVCGLTVKPLSVTSGFDYRSFRPA